MVSRPNVNGYHYLSCQANPAPGTCRSIRMITATTITPAYVTELPCMNRVIAAAVDSWPLEERVKRLSLPVLTYNETDLAHGHALVARIDGETVGMALWTEGPGDDATLHGLYVDPAYHGQRIGQRLMDAAIEDAFISGARGVLVRAERVARGFFQRQGLSQLDTGPDGYPHTFYRQNPRQEAA